MLDHTDYLREQLDAYKGMCSLCNNYTLGPGVGHHSLWVHSLPLPLQSNQSDCSIFRYSKPRRVENTLDSINNIITL